ncbi:MAG: site-2 protease family protein [Candidatus Sericytochromatia bacterium]|nr:site-2 protease family protein [Candidatus Tanganyikabacteria bacterium]
MGGIPLAVPPLFALWTVFLWWSLTWNFPRSHVGFPDVTYRYMAVGATFLVVGSILIHEVLAVAAARLLGARLPDRVVIGPCGGWQFTDDGSTDPAAIRAEIVSAFCGPAIYMGLAMICLGLSFGLQPQIPNFLPTRAVLDMLAIVNSSLAVLNLLPGAPLDAGRVLSAILRRSTGDPERASGAARFGGTLIGLWLVGIGVAGLASFNALWSLWGVILGVAVLEGAQAPQRADAPRDA